MILFLVNDHYIYISYWMHIEVYCIYFVIQKAIFEKKINLDTEKVVSAIKIIDLDTEVFTEKTIIAFVFEIDSSNIHIKIALID